MGERGARPRRGTPQHPQDLAGHRLIGNSAAPVLNRWRFVVDDVPLEVRAGAVLRTDNSGIVLAMALRGLGIARLLWFEPRYTSITRVAAHRSGIRSVISLNEAAHLREVPG